METALFRSNYGVETALFRSKYGVETALFVNTVYRRDPARTRAPCNDALLQSKYGVETALLNHLYSATWNHSALIPQTRPPQSLKLGLFKH
jgi:hypothetical protein